MGTGELLMNGLVTNSEIKAERVSLDYGRAKNACGYNCSFSLSYSAKTVPRLFLEHTRIMT